MRKKLVALWVKSVALIANTWRLGGWLAKGCAIFLVVSPIITWSSAGLVLIGWFPSWVPLAGWTIGHINSMVFVPILILWHNGGQTLYASLRIRLRQLRPAWLRSSDAA